MKNIIAIFLVSCIAWLSACKSYQVEADVASGEYYYTCSMHPQIMETHPGVCPICHMELIKVKRTQTAPDEVKLNDEQIRLANIIVDTIGFSRMGDKFILTATLTADETQSDVVASRMSGRIDRLYFKNTGEYIKKGQPVFFIYSEDLNNAKQELLALVEKQHSLDNNMVPFKSLIETARQKLLLLGMSAAQVDELIKTGKSPELTTFYSPVSGYLTELPVMQGDYVSEGSMVMRIADLSHLWAETQVYASQSSRIPDNSVVDIEFPDLPGKRISGRVSFVSPELIPDTRLALFRVDVNNPDGQLRPGMAAYVIVRPEWKNALTLPVDAVIRDGAKNIVWIQTAPDTFEWREVQTGGESNHRIVIVSGLNDGDKVAVSGVYLLNSEYLLKKGQMMAGHQH